VPLAQAVGNRRQGRVEARLHAPHHRPRDPLGLEAGRAERPLRPRLLRHPPPCDRWRPLPLGTPPRVPIPQVGLQGLGRRLRRHMVHPRRPGLPGPALGVPEQGAGEQVPLGVAHQRRIALGLGGPLRELPGAGG
jgi:hypothetical protein